jgi:hypothetical protein
MESLVDNCELKGLKGSLLLRGKENVTAVWALDG